MTNALYFIIFMKIKVKKKSNKPFDEIGKPMKMSDQSRFCVLNVDDVVCHLSCLSVKCSQKIGSGDGIGCAGRDVRDVGRRPYLSDLQPCRTQAHEEKESLK